MKQFDDRDFQNLAEISGVPLIDLQKLYAMGVIDESRALDYIIHFQYRKIRAMGKYKPAQIIQRLAEEYFITNSRVQAAIYRKHNKWYYCTKCGQRIPMSMYKRNNGVCDSCVARSIDLNI